MREAALAILLVLSVAVAGCVTGEDGALGTQSTRDVHVSENCTHRVEEREKSGTVRPGSPVVAEATAEDGPATVRITFEVGPYVGSGHVVLDHDGEQVWDRSFRGVGSSEGSDQLEGVEAGTYTLTASMDAGEGQATLGLKLTWGDGPCG